MMTTKRGLLFAASLAMVAVLYQVEVLTSRWQAEDFAVISGDAKHLWKYLTNVDTADNWFQWVSAVRAVDSRPLTQGKRYEAIYKLPLIGDYAQTLQVVEYLPNKRVVLESDSLLKPRFTISVEQKEGKYSAVKLKMVYRRNSALFRVTLGPLMWLLTSQQLRHSLFLLKMLFPA